MKSYENGPFVLYYTEYRINTALFNGTELSSILFKLISQKQTSELDILSDKIFTLIKQLDIDIGLYELSIALTNYYFETFWSMCEIDILSGKIMEAKENIEWACKITWKQEVKRDYTFHKGTPYFFLGYCYMENRNLDLAFQMIHNGHIENLTVYPRLGLDYRTAPSYLFMCLNANNRNNYMYRYVELMKRKLDHFVNEHNKLSSNRNAYDVFDKKFLQRESQSFDNVKFLLVYLIMNLINMNLPQEKQLTKNSFSNLRKIELMFNLGLIVDKTLSEKYRTDSISEGVKRYLIEETGMSKKILSGFKSELYYLDKREFDVNGESDLVISALLEDSVFYNGTPITYPVKCMLLAWHLRNFSAHNLNGIDNILTQNYSSLLSMLFSALFFATEAL